MEKNNPELSKEEQKALLLEIVNKKMKSAKRYPLSFSQERIWTVWKLNPDNDSLNISQSIMIHGPFDTSILEKSFKAIISRHHILHSVFIMENNTPVQLVLPLFNFKVQILDCSEKPQTNDDLAGLISREQKKLFAINKDIPVRVNLFKLSMDQTIMNINFHQIAFGAESWEILIKEFSQNYSALSNGQLPDIQELPIQYGDFAEWQRGRLDEKFYQEQKEYWNDKFREAIVPVELPADNNSGNYSLTGSLAQPFEIKDDLFLKIKDFCREEKTSCYVLLLALFNTLLTSYPDQDKNIIITSVSNKTREDLKGLIGLFSNLMPLLLSYSNELSFKDLLTSCRAEVNSSMAHQDYPFEKMIEPVKFKTDHQTSNSLFQVMFAFRQEQSPGFNLSDLRIEPVKFQTQEKGLSFQVRLSIIEREDRITGYFQYNSASFEESTIKKLISHFISLMEMCLDNRDIPVKNHPVM